MVTLKMMELLLITARMAFIKAMEQYVLQSCPRAGAKIVQQMVMANCKLKFRRGTKLVAHMT